MPFPPPAIRPVATPPGTSYDSLNEPSYDAFGDAVGDSLGSGNYAASGTLGGVVPSPAMSRPASSSIPAIQPATNPGRNPSAPPVRSPESSFPSGRVRVRSPEDLIGQVLGSYRLVELIGSGGMGQVYRAEHVRLGREVALKLLRPEYALRPESVARFFQEAQAVNRIRHRNIADVTDLNELDDGTPFIIMELLEGASLREWIVNHYQETERVLRVFVQICDGLSAAHEVDIIHRDLKPDNIMVVLDHNGNDLAKLLDFGIAKLINHEEDEDFGWKTTEGFVMGTPAYMAPEQAGGLPIDARTDIYALGAIMYEMFTGQPVFTGKSAGEYVRKHLNEDPVPPNEVSGGEDLDTRISSVIMRCLSKEPSDRYASSIALSRDLQRILAGEEVKEVSTTRPMRSSSVRAGSSSADASHPSLSPSSLDDDSRPVTDRRSVRRAHNVAPPMNDTGMVVGDLPSGQSTGRRILWSIVPLALAVTAAVAWFYLRPQNTEQKAATDTEQSSPVEGPSVEPPIKPDPPVQNGDEPVKITGPKSETIDDPPKSDPPKPTVAPILTEMKSITVRFESKPSKAKVFEWGSRKAQCSTPCDVSIPQDGSRARRIILEREGFYPEIVTINLTKPRKKVRLKLRRKSRRSSRNDRDRAVARPDGVVTDSGQQGSDEGDEAGSNTGSNGDTTSTDDGSAGKNGSDGQPDGSGDATSKKPDGDSNDKTSDPDETKPPKKVKPSDTLNPFDE